MKKRICVTTPHGIFRGVSNELSKQEVEKLEDFCEKAADVATYLQLEDEDTGTKHYFPGKFLKNHCFLSIENVKDTP